MHPHESQSANLPTEPATHSANGKTKRRLLAGNGSTTATPKFGSQSVITTVVDQDCRIAVVEELLPLSVEKLRHVGRQPEPVTLDQLQLTTLVENVLTKVADLCQPGTETDDLKAVLDTVVAAKQRRAADAVQRIREGVAEVVKPVVETVLARIHATADSPLFRLRELGEEIQTSLVRAKPVLVDAAPTIQKANRRLVRTAEIIERAGEFANDDRQSILGTLKERARDGVHEAFTALLREFVLRHLLAAWPAMNDAAEALLSLEGELTGQLDALNRARQQWVHEQRELLAEPPCNTTLRLAGTSPEEAIAGVLERHRFAGRSDLVSHVLERGVSRLRDALTDRGEQDIATRPAARLLASVPVAEAFAAFRDVLYDELEPEVQSVYGRLHRQGAINVLRTLLQRSRLTSDPGPRGSTRFKLNAYRIVIVSLPELKRPDDHATRSSILRRLEEDRSIVVTEHPSAFDEIVVHRVGGGWPWQVLPSNDHFRKQYLDSAAAGHRPHLVEVLPESPRGEINPVYPTLPNER